ncbi:hypothetical protein F511_14147 [Dorcoceras hygrometricum]|uniref:Uncharacterized protein n=1 Tax=Dorcoceras hygrometricum TaxID=472368 RepID=A0A2Z7D5T5_9LAMI|nr:hypothetical protein F511_14147 [Dorcoceras hygrometricum]
MSVREYDRLFSSLLAYVPHVAGRERAKRTKFIEGLNEELYLLVLTSKPRSYAEAVDNAIDIEDVRVDAQLANLWRVGFIDSCLTIFIYEIRISFMAFFIFIMIMMLTIVLDKDLECTIVYVRCDSGYDGYHETHLIVTVYSKLVPCRLDRQNEDKAA